MTAQKKGKRKGPLLLGMAFMRGDVLSAAAAAGKEGREEEGRLPLIPCWPSGHHVTEHTVKRSTSDATCTLTTDEFARGVVIIIIIVIVVVPFHRYGRGVVVTVITSIIICVRNTVTNVPKDVGLGDGRHILSSEPEEDGNE
ncbi:hypothetical protein SAY86_009320 [Trapa natans]|uniref:Uncharacterized protein n=1 Tax=Trapa natans TaxID=22666 RepID=A0AAN7L3Q4_TRANT|nr:hypothetical protein SAY86_009320 [Trapa natans]